LPIDAALPCGLMLNELITNAFKHAFRGRARGEVHIALSRCEGNEARLSVSDDGVGLDGHIDTDTTKTLGLRLVGLLAKQLNGMISIHRRDPTEISVRFPF
jgi:two-component sensor histidine kinase